METCYKKIIIFFVVLFTTPLFMLSAAPGDVTDVQTFTFEADGAAAQENS